MCASKLYTYRVSTIFFPSFSLSRKLGHICCKIKQIVAAAAAGNELGRQTLLQQIVYDPETAAFSGLNCTEWSNEEGHGHMQSKGLKNE